MCQLSSPCIIYMYTYLQIPVILVSEYISVKCEQQTDFINYLVGGFNPLKNMSSSIGMMKYPIYGKIKPCSSHHQPVFTLQNSAFTGPLWPLPGLRPKRWVVLQIPEVNLRCGWCILYVHPGNPKWSIYESLGDSTDFYMSISTWVQVYHAQVTCARWPSFQILG